MATNEKVHFRLLQMPCCRTLICWVNPRLPNHCPECGTHIYPKIRECVLVFDDAAMLRYTYKEGAIHEKVE